MTTTYNVNITGSLTNNNGVLSGFSDSNYATLNRNFDPSVNSWEIVFKIRRTSSTHTNSVFFAKVFDTWSGIRMQLISTNQCAILGMGAGRNSTTILSLNTWYWVKLKYNNPTYTLYISTDGTYYTEEATETLDTTYPSYNNPCTIGKQLDTTNRPWDGEVDLNESYIKVNDLIFWQGVSDNSNAITKIQLRHDTAANWTSVNPVLLEGEVGIETDTKKQKIGDGSTPWNNLAYDLGSTALQSVTSSNVTSALGYTPYNSTNPNGYISGITSSDVTAALGYTPSRTLTEGSGIDITSNVISVDSELLYDIDTIEETVFVTTSTANVNIVGTLTNNNGVLSGFSTTSYATLPTNFNPSNNPWEMVFKFTPTGNFSQERCIFSQADANWNGLKIDRDGTHLWVSIPGIDNAITGVSTLVSGNTYYVKVEYTTTAYNVYLSTDGSTWNLEGTINSSTPMTYIDRPACVGFLNVSPESVATQRYWQDSIDLNESYIKIGNEYFWRGIKRIPAFYTKEEINALVDGQPVAKYLLVDNTKTAHSASADLSSYINDSTTASYEVFVEVNIESNNSTHLWVGNVANPYINKYGNAFCIGTQTTSGSTQSHFSCWLPLATSSRTLYYQLAGSSASNAASVNLLGYRRLGTNS